MKKIPAHLDGDGNQIFTEGSKFTRLQNSIKLLKKISKQKKKRESIRKTKK